MGCGTIISELEPNQENRYTWFKPSTGEFYEQSNGGGWVKVGQIPTPTQLGQASFSGDVQILANLYSDGKKGKTKTITVGDQTLKFRNGILTKVNEEAE